MYKKFAKLLKLPKIKLTLNDALLLLLPVVVWFSYHPAISLADSASMNLELSLAEIFLLLFAVTALPRIWQNRRVLAKNKAVWLVSAFALWNALSLAWTPNFLRGVLTAGLVWLLALTFLGILSNKNFSKLLPALFRLFIASAAVMSAFAWLQVTVGTLANANDLLLCSGCVASQFGFARATGFTIEPQFFGSLLLAPILILCHLRFKGRSGLKSDVLIGFFVTTLFLTLSRGAIYAFALGLLVLIALNFRQWKKTLCTVGLTLAGLAITLTLQGVLAQANPHFNETFVGATTKTIHQLSLGTIDLRPQGTTPVVNSEAPAHDGYIEESTGIRLSLSQLALGAWSSSTTTALFGAGVGGAGMAMNSAYPDQIGVKEIVQNEYMEILLELGLVGFLFFAGILFGLFYVTRQHKWLWAVIVAFLAQWFFFSGYPNALHIYLILAVVFLVKPLKNNSGHALKL